MQLPFRRCTACIGSNAAAAQWQSMQQNSQMLRLTNEGKGVRDMTALSTGMRHNNSHTLLSINPSAEPHPLLCRFSAELAVDRYIRTGQTVGLGSGPLVGILASTCMQILPTVICIRDDLHSDQKPTCALQTALATSYLAKQLARGSLQVLRCSFLTCMCLGHCSCQ
jgi:hypothetical protein